MEELLCKFCNKTFATKAVLNKHQKTAKYCLEKQGVKNENYKCFYCSKILATQLRLNTHIDICKLKDKKVNKYISISEKKEEELKRYKFESLSKDKIIKELRDLLKEANNTIAEIAKQPKTIQTNSDSDNDCNYHSEDEDDSKLPSTVYEKLNEAIDTIEDTEEEKDNILTVSTLL